VTVVAYLLLMTFASGELRNFDLEKVRAVNASPYNGVAVPLTNGYDISQHTLKEFDSKLAEIKANTTKHVWPVVFLNRIVGCVKCPPLAAPSYFSRIRVMDISNTAGALDDLYGQFVLALRIARTLHSPGIVVDPEPYNDESISVQRVANRLGQNTAEVGEQLQEIGSHLADLACQEDPGAVIWFFYTGLDRINQSQLAVPPAAYVVLGMLRRARANHLRLTVVSGGEMWGYCFSSLERLRQVTHERKKVFGPFLARYPELMLGGTVALWNDPHSRRGWMLNREGQAAECGGADKLWGSDFVPLLKHLIHSYRYVWIYAAGAADYDPYGKKAPVFNSLIKAAVGHQS
jgi:hypothetical protein